MTTFGPSPMTALIDALVRFDLSESTSPPLRVRDLVDPAELGGLELQYGTSRGDAGLRETLAAGAGVAPDEVLVTVGAIEAMYLLAQAACAPGDHAVVATPCFPPARAVPEALGCTVEAVASSFDEGYRLPFDRIAAALRPDTRFVSVATPQNPSGVALTDAELDSVVALVADRAPGAVVLVDETYRESTFGDRPVPRSAAALSPRVVTCSSLSKAHGAPGLRIGWLTVTDPDLYERLRRAKFQTTIACSSVDEFLARRVLQHRAAILRDRARRLEQALAELLAWADTHPVEIVPPDGGALCCLRLPPERWSEPDVAAFHGRLAELDTRVARGSWFGDDDRVFRLGFGHLPPEVFTAALDRLASALR